MYLILVSVSSSFLFTKPDLTNLSNVPETHARDRKKS